MAILVYEGGKLVAKNSDSGVVKEFKRLDELRQAQLPVVRKLEKKTKRKPRKRWLDGIFLTTDQGVDENYQIETDIA